MTKVLEASCVGGVVTVDGFAVPSATILSEGVGASNGVVLLDDDQAFYINATSADLKSTLDTLIDVLTEVKTALDKTVASLTSIDTHAPLLVATTGTAVAQTGTATWVPVAATNIAGITTAATQIAVLKGQLQTLSEGLT